MAANLYARSIFGEDALANLSIEKALEGGEDGPVQGHIRIRAKTQVRTHTLSDCRIEVMLLLSWHGRVWLSALETKSIFPRMRLCPLQQCHQHNEQDYA